MHSLTRLALGTALVGAAAVAYARWEAQSYTVRRATVTVLPPGQPPLRAAHDLGVGG